MTDEFEPYHEQLLWLGSHEIHSAKEVVSAVFRDLGADAGWSFLGQYWDWFEATFLLEDIVASAAVNGRVGQRTRRLFMAADEMDQFRKLPARVPVFRGGCGPDVEKGLSWSLDRKKARWFATHSVGERRAMFGFAQGLPRVVEGVVPRSKLLGLKSGREEFEVIALPHAVRIVG